MTDPKPPGIPLTLLFHDGELADVCALLVDLGTPFVERKGVLLPDEMERGFELVVATPQRMLSLAFPQSQPRPTLIAVCDSDSRGLRSSLQRASIQLMVRRPVHPEALRALLLHSLYRGPEKRRNVRVSIGAPVRFRAGWRQHPAILADLSIGGCRLLTSHAAAPGKPIKLQIPAEVAGEKAYAIKANVLRRTGEGDAVTLTAKFESLRPKQVEQLKHTLRIHTSGPAQYEHVAMDQPTPTTLILAGDPNSAPDEGADANPSPAPNADIETDASPAPNAGIETDVSPAPNGGIETDRSPAPNAGAEADAGPAPDAGAEACVPTEAEDGADRRSTPRHSIDRRVIALGEAASRVLMGRDISIGGMRVNPNPLLVVGQNVRLAIHVGDRKIPLVVTARVHRDDGERGIVLRFHGLELEATRTLNKMLEILPVIEPGATAEAGMIVSEILAEAS